MRITVAEEIVRVSQVLTEKTVLLGFSAPDKWQAIRRLLDSLTAAGILKARDFKNVEEALVAREKLGGSTGIGDGVAFPHATISTVEAPMACFAVAPQGVPFESVDGRPARLILLLVMPKAGLPRHVRTLAGVAQVLGRREIRESLCRAGSPGEVLGILREEEGRLYSG